MSKRFCRRCQPLHTRLSPAVWQMDWQRGGFVHQTAGCIFCPEAGGMGLGPEWTCTGDLVTAR